MSVAVADVNSDNNIDIIVSNHLAHSIGVLLNIGDGIFTSQETFITRYVVGLSVQVCQTKEKL
jgi:hypothetical protein